MPRKPKQPLVTSGGREVEHGEARVAFAEKELQSKSYSLTREAIMKQFGVCRQTAERDIKRAELRIAEDAEKERPLLRAKHTKQLERIADAAETKGDYTPAVQAIRANNKLNGLEIQVVSVGPVSPEQVAMVAALVLTPAQRQKRIAELKRAQAETPPPPADDDDADD